MDEEADAVEPADAFGAIANETRVAILRALRAAEEPQSFSELRSAVGLRDSGQFNYHLGRLTDRFVHETDEGYELTFAGSQVVGAIYSGLYTDTTTMEPFDAGDCPDCGGTLRATYENEHVDVTCTGCEATLTQFGAPPSLLEGFEREELPLAFSNWVLGIIRRAQQGFCPECAGRMRPEFYPEMREQSGLYGARFECETCDASLMGALGSVVLDHPVVVAFHHDHGVDLREDPFWVLPWLVEQPAEVESEAPLRVRVTAELDGDELSLLLDEEFAVVSVERDD